MPFVEFPIPGGSQRVYYPEGSPPPTSFVLPPVGSLTKQVSGGSENANDYVKVQLRGGEVVKFTKNDKALFDALKEGGIVTQRKGNGFYWQGDETAVEKQTNTATDEVPPKGEVIDNIEVTDRGMFANLDSIRKMATVTLNDFLRKQKNNIEINIRQTTVYTDEAKVTRRSKAEKAVIGTFSNGQPKYKTVVPKFIIMDIYDKRNGRRGAKIGTELIGAVDSLTFKPSNNELDQIEKTVM